MIAALRAEFRKLLTVRATYFIVLIAVAIVALFAGYGDGVRIDAAHLHDTGLLASESANAILFVGIILALAGLLLFGNEYRYNTILYTLTASKNRSKSLLTKGIVITTFALVTTAFVTFFSPLCTIIGVHLAGKHMAPQTYHIWPVLWRCLFVGWGYAMYAFILTAIIRSQVGSIVTYLLIPLIGENILAGIFHWIGKYLPFNSLQAVVGSEAAHARLNVSTAHDLVVVGIYIIVGLLVSFILFQRRDAN